MAHKNNVVIEMGDGTLVKKYRTSSIPAIRKEFVIGNRLNFCKKGGAISNGQIKAVTITSKKIEYGTAN